MSLKKTYFISRFPVLLIVPIIFALLIGCPGREPETPQENFRVGTWAGSVDVTARLILRDEPQYWCAAWLVEAAEVRIDEFQDGSLVGTANGNFYHWSTHDSRLLNYDEIASGRWDKYTIFSFDLTGHVDDDGYTLDVVELPLSLADPVNPSEIIEFWDFLYPSKIEGRWPEDGTRIMLGESPLVQGDDYGQTVTESRFREFSVLYNWNIERL